MPRVSEGEYRALAGFRRALRAFLAFSEAAAEEVGLTPRQHQALLALRAASAPPRVADLAAELGVRHHSAVGLVNRLSRLGLVRRRTGARDRREVRLELTARGAAVLDRLSAAHRREVRQLADRVQVLIRELHVGQGHRRA